MDLSTLHYTSVDITYSDAYLEQKIAQGITLPQSLSTACLKRQCEFVAGRLCAQQSLTKAGIPKTEIAIGEHREPIWPKGVIGSIAHCDHQAVSICALAHDYQGVGIDIENLMTASTANKIRDQILTPKERAFINHFSNIETFITAVFSAKESIYKAIFPTVKTILDFHTVSIATIDSDSTIVFTLCKSLNKPFDKNYRFTVHIDWLTTTRVQTLCVI